MPTDIQVSPEEARFLRRFFRRHALPWVLVLGLVAIGAARWAVPAADPGLELRLAESLAAVEALRAENAALRTELDAIGQRVHPVIDRRLAAAEGRIAAIERRPAASEGGATGVAERLSRLEERLASTSSAHDTITRSNLTRLRDLESRMGALDGSASSLPAAPAP
jgi:hypothetical protein